MFARRKGMRATLKQGPTLSRVDAAARVRLTRSAALACGASMVWAGAVGAAALVTGAISRSLALVAFGLDSFVDGSASAMLVWLLAATYVTVQAIRNLTTGSGPTSSTLGLALAAASVLVLPVLAWMKLRLAGPLGSKALRGDGILSAAGAALAAAALLGLMLARALGWWWADSIAGLAIAAALASESWRVALIRCHAASL